MTNTTVYILVGLSFIINFIIILAFRAADSKEKRLKNLNMQVKNFRSEVSSTMNRMSSTARDCEQNISSRIEHANTVQEHLAESIDLVLVHQRELDELSDVCENYGNALKKLKVQTEQAENRLYAVQSEVRKIEAVHEYAVQFQKETERITAQMNSIKADYVRLVASTEQDLKNAAQNQREENNEMLTLFGQSLDRAKAQFSDYIAEEKRAYDDVVREQEVTARDQLDTLHSTYSEIENAVDVGKSDLISFIESIKSQLNELELRKDNIEKDIADRTSLLESDRSATLITYENKRDTLFTQMDNKIEKVTEDLDSAIRNTENTLEGKLRDKEEELSASLENYSDRISEKEKDLEKELGRLSEEREKTLSEFNESLERIKREKDEALQEWKKERDSLIADYEDRIKERSENFDSELAGLEEKRTQYKERCLNTLSEAVVEAQNEAVQALQKIKTQGDDFLKTVQRATGDSERAYHILTETARGKVREAEESLSDLGNRIDQTKAVLSEHLENVTEAKEEIWNLRQEEKSLKSELDSLREDKSKLQSENERAKSDRLNEEANLVRLKGQQKSLQAQSDNKAPTIEEMDIVIGEEEEIDVSDDE